MQIDKDRDWEETKNYKPEGHSLKEALEMQIKMVILKNKAISNNVKIQKILKKK